MGFLNLFKNTKTHEQKMDFAYKNFKPDMVEVLFINGRKQADEVILKLAEIFNIDLSKKNELEYYEILQVYEYIFTEILISKAKEENIVKGLQTSYGKYIKNETMAQKTLNYFLYNYSENIKIKQNEKKENVKDDNSLSAEESLKKGIQLFNNKEYSQAKQYLLKYVNKIEEKKKDDSKKVMAFGSSISFVLYCKRNDLKEIVENHIFPISSVYVKLAYIDFEMQLFDEAEIFLDKALVWDPYNLSAINEKGEIYKAKKDLKKYYFNTLDSAELIYKESDLARYYRNLGFYFIENSEWELAKAVYTYSLKFEFSPVALQELEYIAQKSGNKDNPENDKLVELLKENRIITYISDENIKIIEGLFESLKSANQLETAVGKEVKELVEKYSKHK